MFNGAFSGHSCDSGYSSADSGDSGTNGDPKHGQKTCVQCHLNRPWLEGGDSLPILALGDAVVKLCAMVVAGQFPGITQQSRLFRDPIGHGQGHVMVLAASCDFAAMYRMSPVGHKISERSVTDEQHAILQTLAWDTVSNYPHSGIAVPAK